MLKPLTAIILLQGREPILKFLADAMDRPTVVCAHHGHHRDIDPTASVRLMLRPALIVHGGAGAARAETNGTQLVGCRAALRAGWQVLAHGGSALDAVCEAVAVLEDDPNFNAGLGSCLTSSGTWWRWTRR